MRFNIKRTQAYEALDGSLHKDKPSAAFASLEHLGRTLDNDPQGTCFFGDNIAFVIKHRKKILPILQTIDAPEAKPHS